MELTAALFDLCKSSSRPIIAIDGPAGAGKTTLAEHLSAALSLKYKCSTIHMDDLYNGWSAPFDHHFTDALIAACTSHQQSKRYSLSHFDWSKSEYGAAQEMPSAELLILEGVGASHSIIRPYLTASIWIDIEPSQGLQRVLTRDGEAIASQMKNWLTQQEELFAEHQSISAADFVLTTG
jgi:Ni2+-binding GTPase involved in maturation of urease and hydrogenase